MGIIKAFSGSISGTFADQWKDIITAGEFNEHSAVVRGVRRGTENNGFANVITNGSKIYVPENTVAFIFDSSGLEMAITKPGGYIYQHGQKSVLNGDGIGKSIVSQIKERFTYGGTTPDDKRVAYVNLREIRNIKFGTKGPIVYNDTFYGADLEVYAFGALSLKVSDPVKFIRNFVPPNVDSYSFDDEKVRSQILSEFLQSFIVALSSLSKTYRISQIPTQANEISKAIKMDNQNAGTWESRFGLSIVQTSIESIELSDESRELVKEYSSNKMSVKAYDEVSQKSSNIAAQQKIADGIKENGFGNAGGMIMGMNLAQGLNTNAGVESNSMSYDEQIETVKKLKDLYDAGVLSQDEFEIKKKEVMGL